jgi:ubiquitin-protein ligase E3 A
MSELFALILEEQLTYGCQSPLCTHPYCKSNPKFVFPTNKPFEDLISELSLHPANICPFMPTILTDGNIIQMSVDFDEFRTKFCARNLTDDDWPELHKFLKIEHFPYLFFDWSGQLEDSQLDLILSDFYDASLFYSRQLAPFASSFRDLVLATVRDPRNFSLMVLHSLVTFWAIEPFLRFHHFKGIVLPILNRIVSLPNELKSILSNYFIRLPNFYVRVVATVESLLTLFCNKNPDCILFINTNGLPSILQFLETLALVNRDRDPPLSFTCLANDSFTECFSPDIEGISLIHGMTERTSGLRPDFLRRCPFLFTLEFKREVLMLSEMNDLLNLTIERQNLVRDAKLQLMNKEPNQLRNKLSVRFKEERSQDSGGPSREFLHALTSQVFGMEYGLFQTVNNGAFAWFSPFVPSESGRRIDVSDYDFCGRIVGLAILNRIVVPVRFPLVLYKKLMNCLHLRISELAEIDPGLAEGLILLKKMNQTEIEESEMTFSIDIFSGGQNVIVDLIENGRNIPVVMSNIDDYINAVLRWYLVGSVVEQFAAFAHGFGMVCAAPIFRFMNFDEFDSLVSGLIVCDWEELKRAVRYEGGYTADSVSIVIFWKIYHDFDVESKKKLFKFMTGTDLLPFGGLSKVQLIFQRSSCLEKVPVAHTCTGVFILPDYRNEEVMKAKLAICLKYADGFGLA